MMPRVTRSGEILNPRMSGEILKRATVAVLLSGLFALLTLGLSGCGNSAAPAAPRQAPAIASANSTTFAEGMAGSFTVTATGSPAPSITESGALPGGVTFTAGILSGTPTVLGTFPITFTVSNGVSPNAVQNFTLTVSPAQAPVITSASSTTFTEGVAGSFTVTVTGSPAPSITESGALPGGVTFIDNHDGTGTLSGTPTASGVYSISFTASNSVGSSATQTFTD